MSNVIKRLRNADGSTWFRFFCPGCKETHIFTDGWQFDQNFERPTISPSILVRWPANPKAEERFKEWRTERVCHSFVRDGQIQFLGDCTHDLKNQTVPLPPIEVESDDE